MLYFAGAIALLIILYVLSLSSGGTRREQMRPYMENYVAHRGFFNNIDVPENSLEAFALAVMGGYGIELDVQLTRDNKLVVFHDEELERMCGSKGKLWQKNYDEIKNLRLLGTEHTIPLLCDVLSLVDGKVPLIVEIKSEGRYIECSRLTNELLKTYKGEFCIESFHPLVVRWFKKHSPHIIRGQLSTDHIKDGERGSTVGRFLLSNLVFNFLSKPDFIAFNHLHKRMFSFRLCKKLYAPVTVAWTIKSEEQLRNAKDSFEVFIFDSFVPKDTKM
ncbi:MAG: glycerophosphodiester phosphodiesterase [Oscillospiraceae bacterium]|nr:glycerophosphodiester phosphodiesterase [Oscillospiraceae bacterium]